MDRVNIFWFRRDLRLEDNIGLYHALKQDLPVLPLFIFDHNILSELNDKYDRRVDYIHQSLENLNNQLSKLYSSLLIRYGNPIEVLLQLKNEYNIENIFCNEDFELYGINRDNEVKKHFNLHQFKDHVIFRFDEILKKDNTPYTVFTPYSKQWKLKLTDSDFKEYELNLNNFYTSKFDFPTLQSLGFQKTDIEFSSPNIPLDSLSNYKETRDIPSLNSTTKLSLPLRFGTISIHKCVRFAHNHQLETWLNELIWRDFFIQILAHFPATTYSAFKPKYDNIQWINNEKEFDLWCKGETGYPIVDAGMKELNATGFMHNRVRMIVASFLCKHLLIDWRWGESYFASKLNDYEMASNVGNWQWASSSGCDATPYFRVFNPTLQQQKFDKDFKYIKKWIPNFDEQNYIEPIVPHDFARQRAIETYKIGLNSF
ncbi:cryptochrome/photolyase family protein [Faecalibacter bovis]|uniref:Deoxyribodipyrimidine photo-lyase n=1 Tax=Faecalibacter bovis TaxID=2898187 RepID=A0ABX7XC11_9FLAO|nr:deoxyribodipyrimidine photo-lyase [Faecalibacter bovis]QTV05456.1 deoxyribodipyrimidine photo-lyase [Faecalibacter bovis]